MAEEIARKKFTGVRLSNYELGLLRALTAIERRTASEIIREAIRHRWLELNQKGLDIEPTSTAFGKSGGAQ